MRKRRILSILTTLALCLSLLPATALAADVLNVSYLDADGKTKTCVSATKVESSNETNPTSPITWSTEW